MTYNKDSIKSLDPIEHIRRRPGVYLPDIGIQGLHHLIEEVINNSVDEFLMGHGKQIQITVIYNKIGDKSSCKISVSDQGRGIPFGYREDMGMDVIEATLTKTMTGGKFEAGNYNTSSGMNGIGLKAVNAISKDLTVLSTKSKTACLAHFECGQKVSIKTFSSNGVDGTTISFVPDGSILETTEVDLNILVPRLKYLASILPGLEINLRLVDREYDGNQSMVFKYDQPLVDIHENLGEQLFGYRHVDKGINVELTFHKTTASKILSFVNTVHTYDNGSHVDAIYAALTDSLKRLTGKLFTKYQLSQGMSLTISVFHQDPVFRGQHKGMLSDSSVKRIVYDSVLQSIYKSLQSNTPFLKYLVELMDQQEKLLRELDIQDAINTVKKSVKENRLPAKLSVAHNCTPETRELFIVEGDSAAGCIFGGTEILDVNFNCFKVEELVDLHKKTPIYTFSCSESGGVEVSKIVDCFVTKYVESIIEVVLDNQFAIKCTPDHRFMMRDGSYKEAKDLLPDDSLMPIYYDTSGSRNTVKQNTKIPKWDLVYRLSEKHQDCVDASSGSDILNTHHLDGDKKNDYPNNLEIWDQKVHLDHHTTPDVCAVCASEYKDINNNHKVVMIVHHKLGSKVPVYDITVDSEHHNFATKSGVFIHNSVRRASNKKFQEVLPIRGKIINAHKSDYADVLANTDAVNIFLAVGAMEKSNTTLRTKNVFILTDADDDGKHIVSLLLSLFTVAFPSFVKDFNLHVVYPPLFSLVSGDLRMYGHDGKELVKKFKAKYSRRAYEIYRNKGLGEMDAGEMVEVIHPEKRKIDKVDLTDMSTIEMDKIMGIMGDVRRSLITESEGENNE